MTGPTQLAPESPAASAEPRTGPDAATQRRTVQLRRRHAWWGVLLTVLGIVPLAALVSLGLGYVLSDGPRAKVEAREAATAVETLLVTASRGTIDISFSPDETEAVLYSTSETAGDASLLSLRVVDGALVLADSSDAYSGGLRNQFDSVEGRLVLPESLTGALTIEFRDAGAQVNVDGELAAVSGSMGVGSFHAADAIASVDLVLDAGDLSLGGGDDVMVNIGAGDVLLTGTYSNLSVNSHFSNITVDAHVRESFESDLSMSSIDLRLGPTPPLATELWLSDTDGAVALPAGAYAFTEDLANLGEYEVDNGLRLNGGAGDPALTLHVSGDTVSLTTW